jgi:hypothetical protein
VEPPVLAVGNRFHPVRAHVGAAVTLGQELCAPLSAVVVGLEQGREEALAQLVRGGRPERAHEPSCADDRTCVAALAGLCEEVEERRLLDGIGAEDPRRPHGTAGAMVRGMELDLAIRSELRRISLCLLHRRVDHVPHDVGEFSCYCRYHPV